MFAIRYLFIKYLLMSDEDIKKLTVRIMLYDNQTLTLIFYDT